MELQLTNSTHNFNRMLDSFIQNETIVSEELGEIDNIIQVIYEYKNWFANSDKKPIEIVKVFSGLNLLEKFFYSSKKQLLEGVKKKENPTSAKKIINFSEDIVELSNKIDASKLNSMKDMPNSINSQAIELREYLRDEKLYPSLEKIEKFTEKKNEKFQELFIKNTIKNI